jgi:hypothetical protein
MRFSLILFGLSLAAILVGLLTGSILYDALA